jgi:uncharacterized phage protein gp47/JayE
VYKTFDQIVSEMQADMIAAGSQATDFTDGSQIQTLIAVTARALQNQWYMLEQLVELFFVISSEGPFLDLRVQERGISRKQGIASTGNVVFTRTTPSPIGSLVPAGTVFSTLDGSVEVRVTQDVNLASGWTTGSASVQCTVVGKIGNLPEGTPLQIAGPAISGLQTIAVGPGGLTGGVDTETDDELRARYLELIRNPVDGGTPADYLIWAKGVTGVTNASVFPLARGNGTVDILVSDGGIPSQDLINSVQTVINENRPVGADARVIPPTAHTIDVVVSVTLAPGYTLASVQTPVSQAIQNYISSIPIGGVVRVMAMADAVFKVPGVIDCSIITPSSNITLGNQELAVTGTITVQQSS